MLDLTVWTTDIVSIIVIRRPMRAACRRLALKGVEIRIADTDDAIMGTDPGRRHPVTAEIV